MDKETLNNLAELFKQESSLSNADPNSTATVYDLKRVVGAIYNLLVRLADELD